MRDTKVNLISFGFRYGAPQADMILDMRGMKNPFYVPELKRKTGLDREVQDYVFSVPESEEYYTAVVQLLRLRLQLHESYPARQSTALTFAIGCTGGKHRSVSMTERVARALSDLGYLVSVTHRDRQKEDSYVICIECKSGDL